MTGEDVELLIADRELVFTALVSLAKAGLAHLV